MIVCGQDGCENKFEPKTHNQKYCSDLCCREATNTKIKAKYYEKKERLAGKQRVCKNKECSTKLSRYNSSSICENCVANQKEQERKALLDMVKNVSS
jgi:hypothetical protein